MGQKNAVHHETRCPLVAIKVELLQGGEQKGRQPPFPKISDMTVQGLDSIPKEALEVFGVGFG